MSESGNEGRTSHLFRPSFIVHIDNDGTMTCDVSWGGAWMKSWDDEHDELQASDDSVQKACALVDQGVWGPHTFLPQGEYPLVDLPGLKSVFAEIEGGDDDEGS